MEKRKESRGQQMRRVDKIEDEVDEGERSLMET